MPICPVAQAQTSGLAELHSYGKDDGVNFQNIIEGAPVFEARSTIQPGHLGTNMSSRRQSRKFSLYARPVASST